MKTYITASLIFGFLFVGVFATDPSYLVESNITTTETDNTTTTETYNTTTVETTSQSPNTTEITTTTSIVTTTPITSTTPVPTPPDVRDPEKGTWKVIENNITCIILQAAIQFQFSYEQVNEKFVKTKLNVPANATVDEHSSCEENIISLTFDTATFALKFVEEKKEVWAKQASISYIINNETFPGAKNMGEHYLESADNQTLFKVTTGKSYMCKESKISFSGNVTGTLTSLQVEAFKNSTDSGFSASEECSSDEKINDIVPIAVGCALAALVIIVLIAYLVGRRRTRQRGYQSV